MARKTKKARKPTKRRSPKAEWLGDALPISIDCTLVLWVERKTGELLAEELCRTAAAEAALEGSARRLIERRGKPSGRLCVADAATAKRLREAIEGVAVGAGFDGKADELLAEACDSAPCLDEEKTVKLAGGEATLTLKVTLRDIAPPVWRRVRVAADASMEVLHLLLQVVMGWDNCHLHDFEVGGKRYGMADEEAPRDELDERAFQIGQLLKKKGDQATYRYDFGDDWVHDIVVEDVGTAVEGDPVASCLDGARSGPPEDAGGPWGHQDKLRARAEPKDDGDREAAEWLGEDFDPEAFDCADTHDLVQLLFQVGGEAFNGDFDDDEGWPDSDDALDADIECLYDADRGPEPERWLGLDDGEQHYHVQLYHKRMGAVPPPSGPRAHAALHAIVEQQIANGDPALVGTTLVRLIGEGLNRHEAVHALASVLAKELHSLMSAKEDDSSQGFDELAYARGLKKLTAREWLNE